MYYVIINNITYYFEKIEVKKPCSTILINWFLMKLDFTYYTFKIDTSTFSAHTGRQTDPISSFDCVFEFKASYPLEELLLVEMFFWRNRTNELEINEDGLLQLV